MPTTEIQIGRTTYEVVTSFNGNKNRDLKSTLLRLMIQEAKNNPIESYPIEGSPIKNTFPECG
jgi:hypothetical protein